MSADILRAIDWHRPWLAPFSHTGQLLASSPDWRETANALAEGIRNGQGYPIRFVPQESLPSGSAYESFIFQTGMVPTRENLHDFFNALVWLTFPQVKVQLNARQAAEIDAAGGVGQVRGKVRDAATLFDENAALLVVRNATLLEALRAHHWEHVFLGERHLFWANTDVILFGHALLEKLVHPYKAITAHAWPVLVDDAYFQLPPLLRRQQVDRVISHDLAGHLGPGSFTPLPVLGVPDWWSPQDKAFYSDQSVFRPKRKPA